MTLRNRLLAVLAILLAAVGMGVLLPGPASAHSSCYTLATVRLWPFPGTVRVGSNPYGYPPVGGVEIRQISNGHDCGQIVIPPNSNFPGGILKANIVLQANGQLPGESQVHDMWVSYSGGGSNRHATRHPAAGACNWVTGGMGATDGTASGWQYVILGLNGVAC